ncbi:PREDICTED: putative tripartite motif-containing protein 75 [Nanorana parkeri]|uniref:putative tripartite motif-containing protein 75 n=1 Tax=Nanorana parkeri TaxID=125878 RepID=UPI0008546831|nr:PREDICTED: putative tripartite motif-containing protein 75 [Nanorana parkeri]
MASAGLRKELECSICLNIYTDPVMLKCGHNYCQVCIDCVLNTQEGSGGYSCPECREDFGDRPALHRNITLRNIVENFLSTQPDQEESRIFCSHCVDAPVAAVKSCLHCEVSLCDKHLSVHKRSPEHVLSDPTMSLEQRKCSIHKKILEYYCTEDSACICVSCCLIGEHRGHQMESLDEASEQKKKKLRNVLQKLMTEREETQERVHSLQKHGGQVKEKAATERESLTALFTDIRRHLEELEKRVLSELSKQEKQLSFSISDLIQQLEVKKDELSRKMHHIEELCTKTDPLTVLQESDLAGFSNTKGEDNEDNHGHDKLLHGGGDLEMDGILHALHTGLFDIITGVHGGVYVEKASDILLDVNTASNKLYISEDRKSISRTERSYNRPGTPERFQSYPQVISCLSFSSEQYYWELDVGGSESWRVGVCYPSMDRTGEKSHIGSNDKSWGLYRVNDQYVVIHDSKKIQLPDDVCSDRVRIYLDYEMGQISFYDLCHPMRHLHTFTTTFSEPLHAALGVWKGGVKIFGGNREM